MTDPGGWFHESFDVAKQFVYTDEIGLDAGPFTLSADYDAKARSLAKVQAGVAGARFARRVEGLRDSPLLTMSSGIRGGRQLVRAAAASRRHQGRDRTSWLVPFSNDGMRSRRSPILASPASGFHPFRFSISPLLPNLHLKAWFLYISAYAPREGRTGQPYWKHHLGCLQGLSVVDGTPSRVDDVSARQFQGAQESPLHAAIKNTIGELLRDDARTDPGSVVIDEYLIADDGRRRPDVRAIHNGRPIVVEVQLATTQIPIIVQREDFYDGHAYRLLWVTWNFEPPAGGERMRSSFEDIFFSHNKNLFSMDDETIDLSRQESTFVVRVFWLRDDVWTSKFVRLEEMQWLPSCRAFAIAPEPPWHEAFLSRWRAATGDHGTQWPERDVFGRRTMPGADRPDS